MRMTVVSLGLVLGLLAGPTMAEPRSQKEMKKKEQGQPQKSEFFALFSTDHRRREAVAAAERLRGPGSLRTRAASVLRATADRLAPASAPPRTAGVPAVPRVRPVRSRCHPAA